MSTGEPSSRDAGDELTLGVRAIDHTADVALEVDAPSLEELFLRAAAGVELLLGGAREDGRDPGAGADGPAGAPAVEDVLELAAPDVALLLADWLRELLFRRQVRGQALAGADFQRLTGTELAARLRFVPATAQAAREIKGVTYHGLLAQRLPGGWHARVIFDV